VLLNERFYRFRERNSFRLWKTEHKNAPIALYILTLAWKRLPHDSKSAISKTLIGILCIVWKPIIKLWLFSTHLIIDQFSSGQWQSWCQGSEQMINVEMIADINLILSVKISRWGSILLQCQCIELGALQQRSHSKTTFKDRQRWC